MKIYLLIAVMCFPMIVSASISVAKITALKGSAEIIQGTESRSARLGSDLLAHDRITTHNNTKVKIILQEDTIITVGKNSPFQFDEYVF